ncbi:MAG: aquaporin [Chloroflexi bacterium]|nr:aquaporin [Chloroflexota bacterium]
MFNLKVFLAEFVGTFALVFVGAAAGIINAGPIGVGLAFGFTLAVFFYAYSNISGMHVNPAVTFGLALNGTVKWGQAFFYWIAQFAGAILAAFVLQRMLMAVDPTLTIEAGGTVGALTASAPVFAMIFEAILTFFLVTVFLHTAVDGKGGAFAGWAIGMTLAAAVMVGGPFTGGSLNPARTFGVALFAKPAISDVYTYVIYFLGPLLGATFATLMFKFFSQSEDEFEEYEEVVVEEIEVIEAVPAEEEEVPVKAKRSAGRKKAK